MKKLLFLILISGIFISAKAQEKYFHELKGMEDSSGVTHLFYRIFETTEEELNCGSNSFTYTRTENNIYHLNTSNHSDSLVFKDISAETCGSYINEHIIDYAFHQNDPSQWSKLVSFDSAPAFYNSNGDSIQFFVPIPVKAKFINTGYPTSFLYTPNFDSLYINSSHTIRFPGNSRQWPHFEDANTYEQYVDSLAIPYKVMAIHPEIDSLYFAIGDDNYLYRSESYSSDFIISDSSSHSKLFFDANSEHIYSVRSTGFLRSDNLGEPNSWELIEINFTHSAPRFFTIDDSVSGQLFISDSTDILMSSDYGNTFSPSLSFDYEITGLYKKPDSDLLYVLTTEELFEVNTSTNETTSLKKLPVRNEQELNQIPNQISLQQNYPNPFNPSTVISYQLAVNSLVSLEVFDVTGRKVATLIDGEAKTAGNHQVTFDAGGFSSGMYFYRLQSGEQTFTQKMILVK